MIKIVLSDEESSVTGELDYYDVKHLLDTFEDMVKVYNGEWYEVDTEIDNYYLDKARDIRKRQCN